MRAEAKATYPAQPQSPPSIIQPKTNSLHVVNYRGLNSGLVNCAPYQGPLTRQRLELGNAQVQLAHLSSSPVFSCYLSR